MGGKLSSAYDRFSLWWPELMENRQHFVKILNNGHCIVGLKALDGFVKFPPSENVKQLVGKLGRCAVQLNHRLDGILHDREPVSSVNLGGIWDDYDNDSCGHEADAW